MIWDVKTLNNKGRGHIPVQQCKQWAETPADTSHPDKKEVNQFKAVPETLKVLVSGKS